MKKKVLLLHSNPTSFAPPWNEGFKNNMLSWMIFLKSHLEFEVISNKSFNIHGLNLKIHKIKNKNKSFLQKIIYSIQLVKKTKEILKKEEFDYIFYNINSYNLILFILMIRKTPGVKKILILGSERLIKHIEEFGINFGKSPFFIKKFIFSYFDKIITVSKKLEREVLLEKLKKEENIHFLPAMSFNLIENEKRNFNIKNLYLKFGLTKKDFIISYIGNLNKNRGVSTLLEAILNLSAIPNLKLLICWNGIGSLKNLNYFIKNNCLENKIIITNNVDVAEIFKISSVFVLPMKNQVNILEYPLTILESLYYGTPIICSRQKSFEEIIINNYNGLFFKPNNANDLSKKIKKLYLEKKLKKRLSLAGPESLKKIYSNNNIIPNFMNFLKNSSDNKLNLGKEIVNYYKNEEFGSYYEHKRYSGKVGNYREKLIFLNFVSLLNRNLNGNHVLEIAPGTGVFTKNLLEKFPKIDLTCIDSSEAMINFLKRKIKNKNNFKILKGDARKLPFKKNTFDVIYAFRLLIHYEDIKPFLKEIERVLKPKGIVIVDAHNFFRIDIWNTMVRRYLKPKGIKKESGVESYFLYPWEIKKKYTYDKLSIIKIHGNKLLPPNRFFSAIFSEKNLIKFESIFKSTFLKYFAADLYIKIKKR